MKKLSVILLIVLLIVIAFIVLYFRGWIIFFVSDSVTMNMCNSRFITNYLNMPQTYKINSIDECVSLVAIKKNKPELCNQLISSENCYIGFAVQMKRPSFCERASSQASKDYCNLNSQNQ